MRHLTHSVQSATTNYSQKEATMREILFRGKRLDNGQWVEGHLVVCKNNGRSFITELIEVNEDSWLYWEVDPNTVDQYTGLTDKNGNKIFEGDIATLISCSPFNYGYAVNFKFLFINGSFIAYILDRNCLIPELPIRDIPKDTEITVIGNIYDNPELTKI